MPLELETDPLFIANNLDTSHFSIVNFSTTMKYKCSTSPQIEASLQHLHLSL